MKISKGGNNLVRDVCHHQPVTGYQLILIREGNYSTVNWTQLSNEYRANEQAGDRAEWKWSPSGHQVVVSGRQVVTKWSPNGRQVVIQ